MELNSIFATDETRPIKLARRVCPFQGYLNAHHFRLDATSFVFAWEFTESSSREPGNDDAISQSQADE
jgi:hypothetical protein